MAEFFPRGNGLALFLNAGDPPLDVLTDAVQVLDEQGVDCLELAVPFPGSVTDGPTIRRSAGRALAGGVELADVLSFIAAVRPGLSRLRIALLADWSHSMKRLPLPSVVADLAAAGADGLLVHALPPRLRESYYAATAEAGLPIVTTCYHGTSKPEVLADAAAHASAYLYLVAHYGRSGTAPAAGYGDLTDTVATLRTGTNAPIAIGFGVSTAHDVAAVRATGADAVIVGSAGVAVVESALAESRDVVAALGDFVRHLQPETVPVTTLKRSQS